MKNLILLLCLLMCGTLIFAQSEKIEKKKKIVKVIKKEKGEHNSEEVEVNTYNIDPDETEDQEDKIIILDKAHGNCSEEESDINPTNKAVLGVQIRNASGNNGANITHIYKGSGAEQSGLKVEDLILAIDNRKVMNTDEVINNLSEAKIGEKVEVRVLRNGEVMNFTVEMRKPAEQNYRKTFIKIDKAINNQIEDLKNIEWKEEIDQEMKKIKSLKDKYISKENKNSEESNLSVSYLSGSPNPSSGKLNIEFEGKKEPFTVSVTDINGRELYKEEVNTTDGKYNNTIQLDNVEGTVIIHVIQGNSQTKTKIIIQK
ncbi:MAG: PDZ domain-containing protein [Saprospiraceae bacterium]|nr:PDZ domain-containing protein [Saprospiraceae bacterium]